MGKDRGARAPRPITESRSRAWCFTINNWTESDYFSVCHMMRGVLYGICGKEIGTKTGTPHLQGYCRFEHPKEFKTITSYLTRARIEPAGGSDIHNQVYCSKDCEYREWGTPEENKQGQRNDFVAAADAIFSGTITVTDFMQTNPGMYFRYSRAVDRMFMASLRHRTGAPEVHWRWGLSGTGKTYYCVNKHKESYYIKDGTPWWDGYRQQEAIIFDDFDNQIPFRILLRLLGEDEVQGQYKGGYVAINSPYMYITSEFPPWHYWKGNELTQVVRRLTSVQEIKKDPTIDYTWHTNYDAMVSAEPRLKGESFVIEEL